MRQKWRIYGLSDRLFFLLSLTIHQADMGTAVVELLTSEMLYHKRATLLHHSPHELLPALYLGHVCIQGRIGLVSSGAHIVVIGHGL